ncbi:serine hydrolase domain-containing protein [Phenylobacterium sp.]|uniref:serine hydrolase domain-containing protein n=1 Tax=Phenylobacterium sp. TaxID=1871053 RepID=UPI003D2CBC30
MNAIVSRRALLTAAAAFAAASPARASAMDDLLAYVQAQRTTGFLVIRDGRTVVEKNWPLPAEAGEFRTSYSYETTPEGALLEDVASQQKSFVAVLCAIGEDKGLLDVAKPVSDYLGVGWSKASAEQEQAIRVIHLLTMSSGLDTAFGYAGPAGSTFLYNTPVYAALKRVLAAAAKTPLETLTAEWLTKPAGMAHTAWRQRPGAFAGVGNPTGLVTSPRDTARMGQLVLDGGRGVDGRRVVSEAGVRAMFARSAANPAYGRLWWLNGGAWAIRAQAARRDGPLIPAAPADTVAALGAMDRKLYVVPSRRLVVVRMGQAAPDRDFDQQLWLRLAPALG